METWQSQAASSSPTRQALPDSSIAGVAPALSGVTAQSSLPIPNTTSKAPDIALPMNNFMGNITDIQGFFEFGVEKKQHTAVNK